MSGQPVKTPSDVAIFRKEYMDSLKLQSENNDKNYKANQFYQSKTNDKNHLLVQRNFMNKEIGKKCMR